MGLFSLPYWTPSLGSPRPFLNDTRFLGSLCGVHPRASLTYGVLFILLHEVRHDIFNEDDPTDGDKDLQGPVVRGINFLRKALGLPLRTHYSSQYGLELRKIYSSLFPVGLSKRYVIFEGGVISR